ncbi:MAG: hypothetical protein ACRCZ4_05580 [Plesiomonas sp.]|uniref:hypothetical protein n=1 Tax=Plesiomonas sp. TaxID=2486279 RepID=UPI003F2CC14C
MLKEQQLIMSNPSLIPMHSLRWVLFGDLDTEHFIAAYHLAFKNFLPLQMEWLDLSMYDIPLVELEKGLPAWLHRSSALGLRALFVHVEEGHLQLIITWQRQYITRQEIIDLLCQVSEGYNSALLNLNYNAIHVLPFSEFLEESDRLAESPTCSSVIDLTSREYERIRVLQRIILPAVWRWAEPHGFHREQLHAEWLECDLVKPAGIKVQHLAPIMNVVLDKMVEVSLLTLNGRDNPELTLQIACKHPQSVSLPQLLHSLKEYLLEER